MSKLLKLREQHNELVKSAKNMLDQTGHASWDTENQAKFDQIGSEIEMVRNQIDNHQKMLDLETQENFKDLDNFKSDDNAPQNQSTLAFNAFLRKEFKAMSPDEMLAIKNTMSTTTGSQGGYTVDPLIATQLIEALKDFGGMRREASQQTTSNGADMSWPTTDGTSEIGEWIAQNGAANSADVTFGTVPVNTFKAGSKVVTIPIELLQDSVIDIQALVMNRLTQRIGRISNQGYSVGTGSAQPFGLFTAATVGKIGTSGQTASIIYDDLVDVVESLDIAYLENGSIPCWMMAQALRKVIRKIKDTSGRPIWTPSYDMGIAGGKADQLLGYDVCINNDSPAPAANAKSLAFGDLKQYLIRDAMDVTIFRFDDSAYIKNGQVGFLAWARTGGNLLDTNAVKLYQHSAT